MTTLGKIFTPNKSPEKGPKIEVTPFQLDPRIPSKYITLSCFAYAFMNETSYRILGSLCYSSFRFV